MKMEEKKSFSPFLRQCLVTAAVSTNMIGFGSAFGFPGIMLPQLEAPGSPIPVSKEQASWLASLGLIILIFGNFLIPALSERAGRKIAIYSVTVLLMLGWILVALATSYEVLLIGRIFKGLAFGMFMPLRFIFIGECSSPRYRGGFLSVSTLAQISGVFFVHLTGSIISYQLTALSSVSFAFISLILTIYCPESPSWLAKRGQFDKCRKNFIWLRGEEEIQELDKLIQTIKHLEAQQNDRSQLREIFTAFTKKEFYKPVLLMSALFIMMNQSGGPVMGSYSIPILTSLMGPEINAHFWMVVLDVQRLGFSVVAIYVINKVKRRTLLFSTGVISVLSQLFMGVYVLARSKGLLPFDSLWIPGALINLQTLSLSIGMQPLPAVIAGEVFPLQYRSFAGSIGLIAQCISLFVAVKTFPTFLTVMGFPGTYIYYSGVVASCLVVAWFMLPETSGRTLQEIEEHFKGTLLVDYENPEANCKEKEPLNKVEEKLTHKAV